MFGEMKELAKLASLLKNGPAIRARVEAMRAELSERTVTVEIGGGAVTVVADGRPRVRSISVEPALLAAMASELDGGSEDRDLAQGLIAEAVNAALDRAQAMMMERMAAAMREMDVPLPAGVIEGMLGGRTGR